MLHQFFIFVEGSNDEKFCKKFLENFDKNFTEIIKFKKYSREKDDEINKFIKTISQLSNFDYLFLADIDEFPCITTKKENLKNHFSEIDIKKVFVVIKEIEAWYLAGLDEQSSKELSIKHQSQTNDITKEIFEELKPDKILYIDVLQKFSLETAMQKNDSFKYFKEKFDMIVNN